jgi:CBS domain-containing protein
MAINSDLKTVGEILATNTTRFTSDANAISIALTLLSTHKSGAPVVDENGKFIGFVSEFDLLKAIESGKDLRTLKVQDIMGKDLQAVSESTSIEEAVKRMEKMHLMNLPVVDSEGIVTHTISRHDLLRVSLGADLGIET